MSFISPKCPGSRYPTPDFSPSAVAATLGLPLGVPLNGVEGLLGIGSVIVSFPAGWLYIHVAAKTMVPPTENDGANLKSNGATDAKNVKMIARLVAKPSRTLSEYLMTTAVIKPPKV